MRLINADKVAHEIDQLSHAWEYGQAVSDCYGIVKSSQTVEAIPMWFIKGCQSDHLIFITELIDAWEKRREE